MDDIQFIFNKESDEYDSVTIFIQPKSIYKLLYTNTLLPLSILDIIMKYCIVEQYALANDSGLYYYPDERYEMFVSLDTMEYELNNIITMCNTYSVCTYSYLLPNQVRNDSVIQKQICKLVNSKSTKHHSLLAIPVLLLNDYILRNCGVSHFLDEPEISEHNTFWKIDTRYVKNCYIIQQIIPEVKLFYKHTLLIIRDDEQFMRLIILFRTVRQLRQ